MILDCLRGHPGQFPILPAVTRGYSRVPRAFRSTLFASLRPSCPSCWPSCPSCWPSWRQHVPQVLPRCRKNAILEPTSPKKCFSHLFKHLKIPKNKCFPLVFVILGCLKMWLKQFVDDVGSKIVFFGHVEGTYGTCWRQDGQQDGQDG